MCSSPRPGWWQAGWWAHYGIGRHSARLSPGMEALSWGRFALQRRLPLWILLAQNCVSIWSAAPFQANRRSTWRRPSCHSLLSCCFQRWLALGVKRAHHPEKEWWMRRKDKKKNRDTKGEKLRNEAPKQKPVTGICNSCFCLEKWALLLPLLHISLLPRLAEPQQAHQLVFKG